MQNNKAKQTILVVDDTTENLENINNILKHKYTVMAATSGKIALKVATTHLPDLILLDIMMPEMDGFEVCKLLKSTKATRKIPVILVTASNQIEAETHGLELGAVDFIARPVSPSVVKARIKTHLALSETRKNLEELNRTLTKEIEEHKLSKEKILHMATHDILTGLPNRQLLKEYLSSVMSSAKRYQRKFALMFIDLDGFKSINDDYGHETGDVVLKEVSNRLKKQIRESDIVARLGGDEFILVYTDIEGTNLDMTSLAERILRSLNEPIALTKGEAGSVSGSIGIALYPKNGTDNSVLMKAADKAMYISKKSGKNTFSFAADDI